MGAGPQPQQAHRCLKTLALRATGIAVDPTDPTRLVLTTDDDPYRDIMQANGVWLSEDTGLTWRSLSDTLPMLRGPTIAFNPQNPDQIFFGTSGRGFFAYTIPEPASLLIFSGTLAALAGRPARRHRNSPSTP
ncbi:MAG: hypothetical protein HC898_10100 [Phycisphaerales bacterium]|nr:hypothetical protein [Phycisphaerales bacterium]